jgi:hypothetical protein
MKLTSVERIGRSELIAGVIRTHTRGGGMTLTAMAVTFPSVSTRIG